MWGDIPVTQGKASHVMTYNIYDYNKNSASMRTVHQCQSNKSHNCNIGIWHMTVNSQPCSVYTPPFADAIIEIMLIRATVAQRYQICT